MPKELRKRGKRHKKDVTEHQIPAVPGQELIDEGPSSGPSWIIPRENANQVDPDAPFGYVDPEIKAYFRTVDDQLREWQQSWNEAEGDGDIDPNESAPYFPLPCCCIGFGELNNDIDRRMFLMAALQEISGKERELATDPECAAGVERMIYSMDDFVRRVFMDRLAGS
jgi:nucleolar protein 9